MYLRSETDNAVTEQHFKNFEFLPVHQKYRSQGLASYAGTNTNSNLPLLDLAALLVLQSERHLVKDCDYYKQLLLFEWEELKVLLKWAVVSLFPCG